MKQINLEQILWIHTYVITEIGGATGLRDLGRLEAAIATQTQNVFGDELYPGEILKAAALIRSIIADHPFVDGNKRTAMLTGLAFLRINNISLKMQTSEIEDFAVEIVTSKLGIKDIDEWLTKSITK